MNQESKASKKGKEIKRILKIGLFFLVLAVLIYQLSKIDWSLAKGLDLKHPFALIAAILLVYGNLGMEYLKWNLIASPLTTENMAIRSSFWSGIATGFVSPNGWGNFLGRLLFFRKREAMYIVIATAFSNLSQLLPTLIFGIYAAGTVFPKLLTTFLISGFALLLLYFFADILIPKRKYRNRWLRHFRFHADLYQRIKMPLLFFSLLRFAVFSAQYLLLFVAFGYTDIWFLLQKIWLIYFITSFVPALWSGKVLIRESAALFVFAGSIVESPDVIVSSLLIYLINIALPAMWSSLVWIPRQLKK